MDIVIAGANAYIRENGTAWKDISDLAEGKRLSDLLHAFTSGRTSLDNYGVGKDDQVTKARDQDRDCDRYDATLKGRDGKPNELEVCVADGLVRFVTIETKDNGPVIFEYYDHDVLFLIERPI
jgi:hypothetical protein